jgi:D-threo-aldose 1-dehydrogenase
LGGDYRAALVSVHDPDEFLSAATDIADRQRRFEKVLEAYRGLDELKKSGAVAGVGVGAKDWRVIREISEAVHLDWVMLACSLTVQTHPRELLDFVRSLEQRGIGIINSAVFNAGFLIGGEYYNYRKPDPVSEAGLYRWREGFLRLCRDNSVNPSEACVEFGLSAPGVSSVALNTSNPRHVSANVQSVLSKAPSEFWQQMKNEHLIDADYPLPV